MRATSPAMPDAAETAWDRSPPVAASPLLQRAAAWWCGLDEAGGEGCRVAAETAKRALPADLRATVVLLDVVDDGADFRVVLVGDRVQRHGRAPLIGRSAQERFGPPGASAVFDDLAQAAQTGRPVAGAPRYVGPDASVGRAVHLMLPLRDAGGQVSQILVVIDFLEAPAEPTAPADAARTGWEPGPLAAAAVVLAAFLMASLWLHGLLQAREADRLAGQRAYLAGSLEAALDGIEGAIADLAALVADQPAVTPERFAALADTLLADHPGRPAVRAAVLAPALAPAGPVDFEALAAAAAGVAVTPWPASDAPSGFPALLVWPEPADRRILGYDLWTDPARRAAAARSFEIGRPQASAPVVLTQDFGPAGRSPVSSLLVQAIDRPVTLALGTGANGDTVTVDSAVIAMGITVDALVFGALDAGDASLRLIVYDAGSSRDALPGDPPPLPSDATTLVALPADSAGLPLHARGQASVIDVAGRRIGLWVEPSMWFYRNLPAVVSGGLMALGLVLSGLTGLYLLHVASGRSRLEAEVRARTAEILDLNRDLTAKAHHALMADTAKSRLLATLSHELRTPLNGIMGFTELLQWRGDDLSDADRTRYLDAVAEAGRHMQQVITRFLEVSQATPNAEALAVEPVDLGAIGNWVATMLGPVAERYGVALSVAMTGPGDAAPVVRADPVALRQALLNFVDNGLKFTPAGGRVQLSARRDGAGGVVLEVADSGVGMSAGRLAALEEPLAEGGAAPVNGATGLGLGLSLSRGLLALMGFTSRIESAVDAGTTVWVEIPAKALVAAAAPSSATAPS